MQSDMVGRELLCSMLCCKAQAGLLAFGVKHTQTQVQNEHCASLPLDTMQLQPSESFHSTSSA